MKKRLQDRIDAMVKSSIDKQSIKISEFSQEHMTFLLERIGEFRRKLEKIEAQLIHAGIFHCDKCGKKQDND